MSAFKDFVNANLGIRKVLVSDFGPPIGPGKSDTASGPIGSQYIDLSTGPNYTLYEKTGPNNDTDWVEIRKIGEAGAKPHEPNYSVQFASGDKLGGSSNLTYNYDTNLLKGVSGEFDTFKVLGDLHVLGTSYVHEVKDTTIEGTISGYTGKFTDLFIGEENVLNKINTVDQKVDIVSGDLIHLRDDSIASFAQQALDLIATGEHLHEHIDTVSGDLIATGEHLHEHIDTVSGDLIATGEHLHEHIDTVSGDLINLRDDSIASFAQQSSDLIATGEHLHEHIDTVSGDLTNLRNDSIASFTEQALNLSITGSSLSDNIIFVSGESIANVVALSDDISLLEENIQLVSGESLANIISISDDISLLKDDTDLKFILHSGQNLADQVIMALDIFDVAKKQPNLSSLPIPPNTDFMAVEYVDVSNVISYEFIPHVSVSVRIDDAGNNQVYANSVYNVSNTGFYVKFNPQVSENNNFLDISVSNKA